MQQEMGIEVAVVTSAQQPGGSPEEVAKGVPHFRTHCPRLARSPIREMQLMWALERRVAAVINLFNPDIVHAHSPVLVGLPAHIAAKQRGLPLLYEVRDLWENASVDRGKFAAGSIPYRVARAIETWLIRHADAVVTIGETLRDELHGRAGRKIFVTPNGADPNAFSPVDPDAGWQREWNPDGHQVIAYVGSFQPYEGLEFLIRAMRLIAARKSGIQLLIVGDGPEQSRLEQLVDDEGIREHVTFAGRLPHDRVKEIYAVADLLVYPRIATLTTQLTTPLKPLEALSMQKAVLASDLPALRELISDQLTGILFQPGNPADLAEKAINMLSDLPLRTRLGIEGRSRILRDRRWDSSVARYKPIYLDLLDDQVMYQ
ncbi:MAG: glycosyltransferase [Sterolibacteriaceae bacterium]|nr:glycosyltransferase [Sterolibacteriaceae bacterium]